MNAQCLFVTGIGTGVGKTLVSAILVEKLQADYWKPIQAGDLLCSDTVTVKNLIANTRSVFHEESYRLTQPFSPHKAARLDGVSIDMASIILPKTDNHLIIEGAGGVLVPINQQFLMGDLIKKMGAEVVLVSQHYLGSINHTLLSIAWLAQQKIRIKGIIFNGNADEDTEQAILGFSKIPCLGRVVHMPTMNPHCIQEMGVHINI